MQETREDDFWYFDPPYLISGTIYNQAWTLEEDRKLFKLLDLLDSKNIKWGLSNLFQSKGKSNTELIEWSKKYKVFHLNKQYTNSNYQRKNRDQLDDEVYVTNYEKAGI